MWQAGLALDLEVDALNQIHSNCQSIKESCWSTCQHPS